MSLGRLLYKDVNGQVNDLLEYAPLMQSVSVVPVGITKYREGLYPLEKLDFDDAVAHDGCARVNT